jgi:hypothetical protein
MIFFFSSELLQLILFLVSSQPKNLTRGVAKFFQTNWKAGQVSSPLVEAL